MDRGDLMVKKTDTQNKIIFVWLTNEESRDKGVDDELNNLYSVAKKDKFKVAVYYSGSEDLVECLTKLLIHEIDLSTK